MNLSNLKNLRGHLRANENLARYTSWRVGGNADWLYIPADEEDVINFVAQVPPHFPLLWLGLGSNTLIRDKGIEGIVIISQGALTDISQISATVIRAAAGVACGQLARYSARLGLTGLEFMAGIPGTIGGALAMNAGCYGSETWSTVAKVDMLTRQGEKKQRIKQEFKIAYRHVEHEAQEAFLAAYFHLHEGNKTHSLEVIRELLAKRNAQQPTNLPNGGSVFRNPQGDYAARLIESCGLKGKRHGGASVSTKHANFILNEGQANAADIEELIKYVADEVEAKTRIRLYPEVRIIGRSL